MKKVVDPEVELLDLAVLLIDISENLD